MKIENTSAPDTMEVDLLNRFNLKQTSQKQILTRGSMRGLRFSRPIQSENRMLVTSKHCEDFANGRLAQATAASVFLDNRAATRTTGLCPEAY
jgi:hypothetical protein